MRYDSVDWSSGDKLVSGRHQCEQNLKEANQFATKIKLEDHLQFDKYKTLP
jgi:hypothetical protein